MPPKQWLRFRDKTRLNAVVSHLREVLTLRRFHQNYAEPLARLNHILTSPVSAQAIEAAAADQADEVILAQVLLVEEAQFPSSVPEAELLDLIERVAANAGTPFQLRFWLECLREYSGDERITDLIHRPERYFGDQVRSLKLSAREVLDVALASRRQRDLADLRRLVFAKLRSRLLERAPDSRWLEDPLKAIREVRQIVESLLDEEDPLLNAQERNWVVQEVTALAFPQWQSLPPATG